VGRAGSVSKHWTGWDHKRRLESPWGESTFRFTEAIYRKRFLDKAKELLASRWGVVEQSDDDPAYRHGKL